MLGRLTVLPCRKTEIYR